VAVLETQAAQAVQVRQAGNVGRGLSPVEQPTHVHPPPPLADGVGIARSVGVRVVGAVIRAPDQSRALERRRAEHEQKPAEGGAGAVRAMGEEAVVARGDGEAAHDVERHPQQDRA
jgi:hypothetical protein